MLWFIYDDPTGRNNGGQVTSDPEATLRRAVDIGLRYEMRYMEIYPQDVINFPEVIRYAHSALTNVTALSETAPLNPGDSHEVSSENQTVQVESWELSQG